MPLFRTKRDIAIAEISHTLGTTPRQLGVEFHVTSLAPENHKESKEDWGCFNAIFRHRILSEMMHESVLDAFENILTSTAKG